MTLGWNRAAPYLRRLADASPAERARILLATWQGRPFVEALCGALTDESHDREAERDGYTLLPIQVDELVQDAGGAVARLGDGLRDVYELRTGGRLVFERFGGNAALFRLAERVPAPDKPAAWGADSPSACTTPAAGAPEAGPGTPHRCYQDGLSGAAVLPAEQQAAAAAAACDAARAELAEQALDMTRAAIAGPMQVDVAAAVAAMRAAQDVRKKAAAEAALREGLREASRSLLLPEVFLAGGERRLQRPAPCVVCLQTVKDVGLMREVGGRFEACHVHCAQAELREHRDAAGRSLEDLRRELGACGAQLTGAESFAELSAAVLAARRRDALSVEWASRAAVVARKDHVCALCSLSILKGEEHYDGGTERRAHVACVGLLLQQRAAS